MIISYMFVFFKLVMLNYIMDTNEERYNNV